MLGTVRKWGNSAAIRLPANILEAAHLHVNQAVDVREEDGRIVIQPVRPATLSLEALTAAITDDNRHGEVSFGSGVGGEIW
ncbi:MULTISPECIES: AbrB/MazE/SpoVT family DNA-binding domain-containing protein [Gluconobacter]|uniref:AbrB/MazE/SpoVT family DNA-binding domain-containing protein n=1 Tax=Gluconobacter TaxID=441 RepID=UPI0009BE2941|nr:MULTISPECIES: AbrB/MazE/SpoVT family DNA-binding domain-containing protein [Gluconobacter]MBF0852305.1 AbrB/MazE/SpoVT family DNA-binding domain-containing protein [Gluconobacter sp. R75690]MBF0880996.1 AbrB/MazE/SpoVT family DNA-binding domain-containing protein [Gluconobacter sp. R75828]MCP1250058.1 AbrB/MazE/SpoVT family DNA-binding domain-containing protein [Gluconobacter oxydans]WKE47270.1 AbrB/MazE/SpoVT family DNA-binding domain-containing protein [Gluconobacter oxydans]